MKERPLMLNVKRFNALNPVLVTVCFLLVALLLADFWFVRRYHFVDVKGGSMENTLFTGDVLYADREATPQRGDIIVIDVTGNENFTQDAFGGRSFIIKRLIALEGDTVKSANGVLYVRYAGEEEFVALDEPYTKGETGDIRETVVGEGEIFFLGDHRNTSTDSEEVGCLPYADIYGVVPEWALKNKEIIKSWRGFLFGE